jgi:hypothetical protein
MTYGMRQTYTNQVCLALIAPGKPAPGTESLYHWLALRFRVPEKGPWQPKIRS